MHTPFPVVQVPPLDPTKIIPPLDPSPENLLETVDGKLTARLSVQLTSEDGSVKIVESSEARNDLIFDLSVEPASVQRMVLDTLKGTGGNQVIPGANRTLILIKDSIREIQLTPRLLGDGIEEVTIIRPTGNGATLTLRWPIGVTFASVPGPSEKLFYFGSGLQLLRVSATEWVPIVHGNSNVAMYEANQTALDELRKSLRTEQHVVQLVSGQKDLQVSIYGQTVRAHSGVATIFQVGASGPLIPREDYLINEQGLISLVRPVTAVTRFFVEYHERELEQQSLRQAAARADSTATSVAGVNAVLNDLLAKLRDAGIIAS